MELPENKHLNQFLHLILWVLKGKRFVFLPVLLSRPSSSTIKLSSAGISPISQFRSSSSNWTISACSTLFFMSSVDIRRFLSSHLLGVLHQFYWQFLYAYGPLRSSSILDARMLHVCCHVDSDITSPFYICRSFISFNLTLFKSV